MSATESVLHPTGFVLWWLQNEMRWYRGTPVVLMLDKACFYFDREKRLESAWNRSRLLSFRTG
jgi:hypothetical protein